jgi:hypothetical protein
MNHGQQLAASPLFQQPARHAGFDELEIAEFLKQTGEPQTALIDSLFPVPADA